MKKIACVLVAMAMLTLTGCGVSGLAKAHKGLDEIVNVTLEQIHRECLERAKACKVHRCKEWVVCHEAREMVVGGTEMAETGLSKVKKGLDAAKKIGVIK